MFFLIYLACGLYLWLLGAAVLGGWKTARSLFRVPWLGYAVLIACLQIAHIFTAINPAFSWTFLAASVLCAGGIVVFPSDGLYGLACDPLDGDAIRRIHQLKGRDDGKPSAVMYFSNSEPSPSGRRCTW